MKYLIFFAIFLLKDGNNFNKNIEGMSMKLLQMAEVWMLPR